MGTVAKEYNDVLLAMCVRVRSNTHIAGTDLTAGTTSCPMARAIADARFPVMHVGSALYRVRFRPKIGYFTQVVNDVAADICPGTCSRAAWK